METDHVAESRMPQALESIPTSARENLNVWRRMKKFGHTAVATAVPPIQMFAPNLCPAAQLSIFSAWRIATLLNAAVYEHQ